MSLKSNPVIKHHLKVSVVINCDTILCGHNSILPGCPFNTDWVLQNIVGGVFEVLPATFIDFDKSKYIELIEQIILPSLPKSPLYSNCS